MSTFCPKLEHAVTYLVCMECDDKVCKMPKEQVPVKRETINGDKKNNMN